jgi:hypothetical protein
MRRCVLIYFLAGAASLAQNFLGSNMRTGKSPEDMQRHVVESAGTNVVRLIDGKVYHVLNSTNWVTIPSPYYLQDRQIKVVKVFENKLIISEEGDNNVHLNYVIVTNHPQQKTALTGDHLKAFRAMKIGRVDYKGDAVALYDWGLTPQQVTTNKSANPPSRQKVSESK